MIKRRHLVSTLSLCSSIAAFEKCHPFARRRVGWTVFLASSSDEAAAAVVPVGRPVRCDVASELLSRDKGRSVVNCLLLPSQEYDKRSNFARDAQGVQGGSLLNADDPVLSMAYGEFPLESFDELLDLALLHRRKLQKNARQATNQRASLESDIHPTSPLQFVDVGSGCGRLVFYVALTRGVTKAICSSWDVHGIEIANELHHEAVRSVERGIEAGLFQPTTTTTNNNCHGPDSSSNASATSTITTQNTFSLHLGPVAEYGEVLQNAKVLFSYSSVFPTSGFSEELGAMLLDSSWSQMLADYCQPGCVAITTDRVLDPKFGWKLLDQRGVDNREIWGSIGYIHVLK